jgi:hypothetical protein
MRLNIDERLEKLAARHEALAQSLEILTHDVETLKDTVREQNSGVMSILQGLIDVVRSHENRLGRLESGTA